ncbi:MAG: SUMF1/EgtB/PvdO family nonheme iron enzyme, partial [Planctomycetota bacterium]|nr:SUMF1/EgtB/PvdO family nonheme iron enzyme [Planctomycetota bacterium]
MNSPATSAARGFAVIMILFGMLNLGCGTGSVTTSQGPVKTAVLPKWVSESGVSQILVPAGDFEMGSGESDEGPRHRVQIAAFVMDQYEVLQEELTRLQIPDA